MSQRAFHLAAFAVATALTAMIAPARADAADSTAGSGHRIGISVSGGSTVTGRPEDRPGDITLLYGTGFTGSLGRFAFTWRHAVVADWLTVGAELGFGSYGARGYAEADGAERKLRLQWKAVDLPLLAVVGQDFGSIGIGAHLGLGPRFGVTARATDERAGDLSIDPDEPAPEIRVGPSLLGVAGVHVAWIGESFRVPLGFGTSWNLTYPNTTEGRLDDGASLESPGAYLVETDFTWMVSLGVEMVVGR